MTISGLYARVRFLEGVASDMQNAFSTFADTVASAAWLEPPLATDYNAAKDQFEQLTENAFGASSSHGNSNHASSSRTDGPPIQSRRSAQQGRRSHSTTSSALSEPRENVSSEYQNAFQVETDKFNDESHHAASREAGDLDIARWDNDDQKHGPWPETSPFLMMNESERYGTKTINGPFANYLWNPPYDLLHQQPVFAPSTARNHGAGMVQTIENMSPKLGNELPLPATYSHYESFFARRLIRATVEDSYRLLMDFWSRPEELNRLCTFAFCFMKVPRLLGLFKQIMDRTANDNLEQWAAPHYHIGNAGLHYPRVGKDASSDPPPWWANRQPIGPFPAPDHETPISEGIVDILEYPEVDGEWLDSNDAVEYLKSKGLNLDLHSDIVEITDAQESELQASAVNTMPTDSNEDWSQMLGTTIETWEPGFEANFVEMIPSSDEEFAQSLGLPVLPETMLEFPMMARKCLDVEKFVKCTSHTTDTQCLC